MLYWSKIMVVMSFTMLLFSANSFAESKYQELSDNFRDHFRHQLAVNKVPGGALVILENDQILKMSTYGKRDKNGNKIITFDTVFRLASVSKTFAGSLATMMVHENKFQWDDPLIGYMPKFALLDANITKQINLGHLIGHSTGLMPNTYDNILNAHGRLDRIIPKFAELSPICTPGTCYSYQNIAFSFIQEAIEGKSGKDYQQLMQERIFSPLNMNNASVGMDDFIANKNHASPHIKTKYGFKKVRVNKDYYQVEPAAGVNASIRDMSKWIIANLGNNPEVLNSTLLDEIKQKGIKTTRELRKRNWGAHLKSAHYGKGWRVYDFDGHELIYHAGWVSGFVAEVAYSPELKIGMAILLNGESAVISELGAHFWQEVFSQ
ncbi:serine hydrolase domain-containing protein [Alteromonadaceae bacterium BrNp21-10]|nr:serine hydrolase domain-containing protein [Alteromonadaceae bacterium BrNp21-10]